MASKKKTPSMIWVRKSPQSAKMAETGTKKMTSSECSLLSDSASKLQLCSSPSAKMTQPATKEHTLSVPHWSLLPEELLHIISENLEDCFDAIHARSVCRPWRSIFPFPASLLRPSYSLPSFAKSRRKTKDLCTLEKIPLFLFRVRAPPADVSPSEYYVGGINRDKSEDHMVLPSPLQCSVKVKIEGSDRTFLNILDCQILPLGYQYRMIGWDPQSLSNSYTGVAFLPLNKQGGDDIVVLLSYSNDLFVLRSTEMKWVRLNKISRASCKDLITFRGRFYAVFLNRDIFVIDPYSLEATPLMPSEYLNSQNYLVPSGNDELYLVEVIIPRNGVLNFSRLACRVSKLDEEAGTWIVVSHLEDRVLFIGDLGYCSCSAKELPDGCGITGNSILMTFGLGGDEMYAYKYGVPTGNVEDDLSFWRYSRENLVTLLNKAPPVLALRIEC